MKTRRVVRKSCLATENIPLSLEGSKSNCFEEDIELKFAMMSKRTANTCLLHLPQGT